MRACARAARLTTIKTPRSRKTPPALKLLFAVTCRQAGRGAAGLHRGRKVKTGTLTKPRMTDAFCVIRGAGEGAWSLSERATKLGSPAGIAGLKVKGHHRTFGRGRNGDLEFRSDRSMTKGLGGCRITAQTPWAYPEHARKARLAPTPRCRPCPQDRLPLPPQRERRAWGSERD
jgi:hypothetical protein